MPIDTLFFNIALYLGIILSLTTVLFFIAQYKKDNSIIDIVYGPLFVTAALAAIIISSTTSLLPIIICGLMGLWALRLGSRLYKKNSGKPEDVRYANWRNEWTKQGKWYFYLRSYLQINVLQGIIIVIVALPFIISLGTTKVSLIAAAIGSFIFFLGLSIETLADRQLDQYLARKSAGIEPAPIMTTGLFTYSRRPNYFGESLVWWGLAIMVLPLPFGWIALLSPLSISYVLIKISGPMIEKIFIEKYGAVYLAYMEKTSYFIPLPPKK